MRRLHEPGRVIRYIREHTRLSIAVIVPMILLASIAGYGWYSIRVWQQIDNQVATVTRSVAKATEQLERKEHSPDDIARTARSLEVGSMCDVPPVVSWQVRLVSSYQELLTTCQSARQSTQKVHSAIEVVHDRVESEAAFSRLIESHYAELEKIDPVNFEQRRVLWQDFAKNVATEKLHASLRSSSEAAKSVSQEIQVAYTALQEADQAQDRAKYDEARAQLERGYSQIPTVGERADESYQEVIGQFRAAVKKL